MRHPARPSASHAPNPRRAWTLTALLAAAFLLAPGVLAGVKPDDAGTLLDAAPDPTGLREHFRDYELQVMDPYLYRAQLATGAIDVVLRGKSFHVLVEPVPWDTRFRIADLQPDGTYAFREPSFQRVSYEGRVAGHPASHAFFVVTGSGVFGNLVTAQDNVWFEPLRFLQQGAPPGVSVVYHAADAVVDPLPGHDSHASPDAAMPPSPEADGPSIATGSPGPNRRITLWVDVPLADNPNVHDIVWSTFDGMNIHWKRTVGFQFVPLHDFVWTCNVCTAESYGPFLTQFATKVNVQNEPWSNYEVAHLMSGRDFGNVKGSADQPGRNGFIAGASDTLASRVRFMMHELGHNFNAWHSRGVAYAHNHGSTSVMHSSIMANLQVGSEAVLEFSSANANWIRSCNAHTWASGSKAQDTETSFGIYCHRGLAQAKNGGEGPFYTSQDLRGKLLNVAPGEIGIICAYFQSGGTNAVIGVKRLPDAGPPLFTLSMSAAIGGWMCGDVGVEQYWPYGTMFLYKMSGTGAIGFDTVAPFDGRASNDGGATWFSESVRRGYYVETLSSELPPDTCGALLSGHSLAPNAYLQSCNGQHKLVHQLDGNVVLYNGSKVDWATHTPGPTTSTFVMQGDGNLVLYAATGPLWASNTAGNPGAWLTVRDDGLLMIVAKDGKALWVEGCGLLGPNSRILQGKEIRSCDRRSALQHQTDGNVVLTRDGVPAGWATNTVNQVTREFRMQDDGNLVLYGPNGEVRWASDSQGNPNAWLRVQDDGKLILWTPYGTPICHKMKC